MKFAIAVLLTVGLLGRGVDAAGGASKPSPSANSGPSLEEEAVKHYNDGLKHRDKAWEHEEKAAAAKKQKEGDKYLKKAKKEYEKAAKDQLKATQKNSRFHEAFTSLGYAYRKVGEYEEALRAYDRALELNPNYTEAIEYRAEAYLGLNRIVEAQAAYEKLFTRDPKRAGPLLAAVKQWVEWRAGTPVAEISAATLKEVGDWIVAKEKTAAEMGGTGEQGNKEWR